jgi:hypothetical protein
LSIFTAIQGALFAALPNACIKSTFPHTATTSSYEVTTLRQGIELRWPIVVALAGHYDAGLRTFELSKVDLPETDASHLLVIISLNTRI